MLGHSCNGVMASLFYLFNHKDIQPKDAFHFASAGSLSTVAKLENEEESYDNNVVEETDNIWGW